ncbi:unnamed protein product [Cylindrotheca closterium]|uniref:Uncharacterized protein n=1 Tax=Cylindrotheca closterium TaxID=2856 RepID=A0AAD2G3G4_9STRA|nr:unnamed protein product [Cylindrotheca closterium]
MKTNLSLSSFLVFATLMSIVATKHCNALLTHNHYSTRQCSLHHSSCSRCTVLANSFEQLPGESDIDFIERITSNSKALLEDSTSSSSSVQQQEEEESQEEGASEKPKGKYQPIEEWDAERKSSGELSWEEKVMFDGQQHGNQVRQNDILIRNLHSF